LRWPRLSNSEGVVPEEEVIGNKKVECNTFPASSNQTLSVVL
jgi:hypothetical protein